MANANGGGSPSRRRCSTSTAPSLGYFEWQRVLEAMANGCVVVTEHSIGFHPLVPGQHFVSAGYDTLPHVLEALLGDEPRMREISAEAYDFVRTEVRLAKTIPVLRDAAVDVLASAPAGARTPGGTTPPAPRAPQLPAIEYERLAEARDDIAMLRMGVKHLLLEQRQLRRELARREAARDVPLLTQRTFGPYAEARPRVSVLVTVYNFEHAVREALESVSVSTYPHFEVVVVDDGSHDGSVAAVERALEALPWVPALHLVRRQNAGLAAARNLAAARARGDLVFILDADNAVYPHALERLVDALDETPGAAFAYGILEKVDAADGVADLVSWQSWDPARLRFGNYIDAMALIRRDVLLGAGGYTSDFRLYGWEDFALWCAFAQAGHAGVHVPEIIARYVAALHSMITVTNIDASEAYSALARSYPFMAGAELTAAQGA